MGALNHMPQDNYQQLGTQPSPYQRWTLDQVAQALGASPPQEATESEYKRLPRRIEEVRRTLKAKQEVLEFFQAQLGIDPWKENNECRQIFHDAIEAACRSVTERKL
jgi:hypothetical protein